MVVGAVAHQAGCRQKCSRKQRRAQTRCRHRKISKTGIAPGAAAHSSAEQPHQASGRPPLLPGELQSWDSGMEERPEGRTGAILLDQTLHSLWTERRKEDIMAARCEHVGDNSSTLLKINSPDFEVDEL